MGSNVATSSHGKITNKMASSKQHQLIQPAGSLNTVLAAAHSALALAHSVIALAPQCSTNVAGTQRPRPCPLL